MDSLKQWILDNRLVVGLASVGFLFILFGIASVFFKSKSSSAAGVLIEEAASTQSAAVREVGKIEKQITVDVEGAVIKPGVYTLPEGSRLQEALIAAGGVGNTADRSYIEKNINLSVKLTDGAKIYIPRVSETPLPQVATGGQTTNVQGVATTTVVNINTASVNDLDTLSGVGPVTAQKIVDNRPYGDINELVSKKAVSKSVFEKIKEKVSVN